MLRLEALTPEALALAPSLCAALEGTPFVLAGGTGLALQLGHRISVDFDWFCRPDEFPESLRSRLTGLGRPLALIQEGRQSFECLLSGVKCSFFGYTATFGAAPDSLYCRPLAPVEDIGVMKLIAVSQRGAKKDFFDLYEILRSRDFSAIIRRAKNMLSEMPVNPMHLAKSLAYFEDAEGDPDPVVLSGTDWQTVKAYFTDRLREHTDILRNALSSP